VADAFNQGHFSRDVLDDRRGKRILGGLWLAGGRSACSGNKCNHICSCFYHSMVEAAVVPNMIVLLSGISAESDTLGQWKSYSANAPLYDDHSGLRHSYNGMSDIVATLATCTSTLRALNSVISAQYTRRSRETILDFGARLRQAWRRFPSTPCIAPPWHIDAV
jgi:hypothetical protein